MNDKLKIAGLGIVVVVAIALVCIMGFRYFGPQQPMPKPVLVSIADLARQEKKDPSVLTDDQRRLLASIPAAEKEKLLTKKSFSPGDVQHRNPQAGN
jgi:hypothetical protein